MERSHTSALAAGLVAGLVAGAISAVVLLRIAGPERTPSQPVLAVAPSSHSTPRKLTAPLPPPEVSRVRRVIEPPQPAKANWPDELPGAGKVGIPQWGSRLPLGAGDGGIFSG